MIAILLAAQLSVHAAGFVPADIIPESPGLALRSVPSRPAKACSGASRQQASEPLPTLLFREQDRPAAQMRKLKDLPPAEKCLATGTP